MRSFLLIPMLFLNAPAYAQSSPTDSQTLQALLAEVRQLRHDLQLSTIAAQRAQILLHRVERQESVVAGASQKLEEARAKLTDSQSRRARLANDIKQTEDLLSRGEGSASDRKAAEDALVGLRAGLSELQIEEQQRQSKEMEADDQLRTERGKLAELEAQLDRMDRSLEKSSQQMASNAH